MLGLGKRQKAPVGEGEPSGADTGVIRQGCVKDVDFQERPRICLIDIDEKVVERLSSHGFNCTSGTLGRLTEVPNRRPRDVQFCLLDFSLPPNLHEYDIVVVDLQEDPAHVPYNQEEHTHSETKCQEQIAFASAYPQTVFDPRAMASAILASRLEPLLKRQTLLVVFAASAEQIEYVFVRIGAHGAERGTTETHRIYDFYPDMPATSNVTGKDTEVAISNPAELAVLLQSHNREAIYEVTFRHPTHWDGRRQVKDETFTPLMLAADGSVISFVHAREQSHALVFPRIKHKADFLLSLLQCALPAVFPRIFPYSTQFAWLSEAPYLVSGEGELVRERKRLQQHYEQAMSEIEERIATNRNQHQFLHDLLTQTGDGLVKAVETTLRWLEFENVVNVDETEPELKEEDLRIDTGTRLLVIEVKGIGGTSTDSECSQISKIKYRRARQRGAFDVSGLYLVNHQRYLPPEDRKNPPFSPHQIQDAESDERGLLTTYDLFKLYQNVEAGFVRKCDAREALFRTGLVLFPPSGCVDVPAGFQIHHNGTVVVFRIPDTEIHQGMCLVVDNGGVYTRAKIQEIQVDGNRVVGAGCGEVGAKLDCRVGTGARLWIPNVTSGKTWHLTSGCT